MKKHGRVIRACEVALLVASILLLGTYGAATVDRWSSGKRALKDFDMARSLAREGGASSQPGEASGVDFSLWSDKRVAAYTESLSHTFEPPLAVLSVPKLKIRVPVLEGTDDLILNRGAGWIPGTARPGKAGNSGIAGHRDGFFRALKDIGVGDDIRLETTTEAITYTVDAIRIVSPEDVSVLANRHADSLTLVTCYPFYFVGDAPQRWIVHASVSGTGVLVPEQHPAGPGNS